MGTYITCELKPEYVNHDTIAIVNGLWNVNNKGYENTFHLNTREDIQKDIVCIQTDPKSKHLRYIKTVSDFNKAFPIWRIGTFQVKITLGDYLCSEMARRYLRFFDKYGDIYFIDNPVKDDYIRDILEDTARKNLKARSCLVKCPGCTWRPTRKLGLAKQTTT